MSTHSKLIAGILGIVVAVGIGGAASARPHFAPAKPHVIVTKTTKVIVHAPRRAFGMRVVKHVRVIHRAPGVISKVVRITKRPLLQKQAFAHRLLARTTILR